MSQYRMTIIKEESNPNWREKYNQFEPERVPQFLFQRQLEVVLSEEEFALIKAQAIQVFK